MSTKCCSSSSSPCEHVSLERSSAFRPCPRVAALGARRKPVKPWLQKRCHRAQCRHSTQTLPELHRNARPAPQGRAVNQAVDLPCHLCSTEVSKIQKTKELSNGPQRIRALLELSIIVFHHTQSYSVMVSSYSSVLYPVPSYFWRLLTARRNI